MGAKAVKGNQTIDGVSRVLLTDCAELLSLYDSGGGSRERFAVEDLQEILNQPEIDSPPETGHAIPQWLRDQFDVIELEVRKMGAEGVFTQMRTKVQAYFEMLRSVESGRAGRDLAIITQQKNLIASLREDLQEAIAIDCDDDARDACAEVERAGTPGSVIREMNDELACLRTDAERFQFIARDAESSLERIYGDNWLGVVDQLRGMGDQS